MAAPAPAGFTILSLLGSGGHGEVYRARSPTGGLVALKVLRPTLADRPRFIEALERECQILSELSHPHIVEVFGLTEVDGRPALVMELLEGADLRAQLQRGPLSAAEACEVLVQLLSALAYLHDSGIVHRDIKPANVFWTSGGRIVLTDFGVALADHGGSTTGRLKGSLGYMAPERFQGVALPASDLYAVGLLAWELVTGVGACPPGDLASRMHWHLHIGPPDPRNLMPGLPDGLCTLLAALLAPRPHERPEDGAAALLAMQQLGLCGQPTLVPTGSLPAPDPPPARSRQPAWALGAVTLTAVLGTLAVLQLPPAVWLGGGAAAAAVWIQGRGGTAWATLWLLSAVACVLPLLGVEPQSWVGAAVVGMISWWLSVAARSRHIPFSVGELIINLFGLGALCTLFWHGVFNLIG